MTSQYESLHRKIVMIMAAAATTPLLILAAINFVEFQESFILDSQNPFRAMVLKSKSSFELFFAERASTISLIASSYSYEELADSAKLQRIFQVMQKEFSGFVDLGLISGQGRLVSYAGPHKELQGVDYSSQDWFHKVHSQHRFISEVFQGFRRSPHVVIAVRHITEDGRSWIVRATIDTSQFGKIIAAMNLEPGVDAFLVNRQGRLQTDSIYYGKALDSLGIPMPAPTYQANSVRTLDSQGQPILLVYSYFADTDYVLMAIKPTHSTLRAWSMMRLDILLIFVVSVLLIYVVAARSVGQLIARLKESDEKRELALLQIEHTQKLSSLGRLAAGVAHEINNPLAIINEKAGLLSDLMAFEPNMPRREQFEAQLKSIRETVGRCRDITHRMLGFARRMEVKIEELDVNAMIQDTLLFLEKEAIHRKVCIIQDLAEDLPKISSDRGQLQQVFLNVLTNALAAVDKGGETVISTRDRGDGFIKVSFADNGCGMSEETQKHIFEPFFTTKKEEGTGLGMAIIYGIVKRHGGDIQVQSQLGCGTTVTVVLPVKHSIAGVSGA